MRLLVTHIDRASLPDDVEMLKDMLVQADQALQAFLQADHFVEVYRIEGELREADPDERLRVRQLQTQPVMAQFERWLRAHAPTVLPKSPLGEAFGYSISNWGALNTFVEHGILEADNNISERARKPVALSRKNWLFAGSPRGGRAAAVAFSLIETARLNGVAPYAHLRDVLQRIDAQRQDRLAALLPMNWRPA